MTSAPTTLPHLSEDFHKARHLLAILSGILMMWEFLGLSVGPGSADLAGVSVTIAHGEAIPYAIIVLIAYSWFRMGVEWFQCDARRRNETASIVDLVAAYAISILAIALFVSQRFTPFKLATGLRPLTLLWILLGFAFAPLVIGVTRVPQSRDKWERGKTLGTSRRLWTILSGAGIAAILGVPAGLAFYHLLNIDPSATLGFPVGSALCGIAGGLVYGRRRARQASPIDSPRITS